MMWQKLKISQCFTFHTNDDGEPAYAARFDEVLKFHSPGLAPVRRDECAWHIRPDGSDAYTQRYRRTFGFYEGLAAVNGDTGWHHITTTGQAVYPQRYDWCGNFQGGRCAVRDEAGAYLHIDLNGDALYNSRWRYAGDYRDGIAVAQASDGRSTHIDLGGELIHSRWFIDLDVFHKGYARARDEDGWCHVDLNGLPTYTQRFAAVEPFYNGQARVELFDGALEVINELGQRIVQLRPARHAEFAQLSGDMVGFWRTQTLGAAVELGLPEALPGTTDHIANACQLTTEGARRLLRALGELGITSHRDGSWSLTPRGEPLRHDHPLTLAAAALEYAGPLTRMWQELPRAIQASSMWAAPDIFGELAQDDSRREGHHHMLRSYARHDYPLIAKSLALSAKDRVIDAGGGLGVLAQLLLDSHPTLDVTVLDRPEVVDAGRRESAQGSIKWHGANLFDSWGLEADAVIFSRVLHDWSDEDALVILRCAREVLPVGGRVFIVELLLSDDTYAGALCDLHLLMATGGRDRSAEHYERLLSAAGFGPAGVRHVAALPSIVMGVAQ